MSRSGFTFMELMVVVVIVGVIAMIGFPKIKDAIDKTNVRSARSAAGTYVATARQAAIQRGCRGVVHFSAGASGKVWVTVCPRMSTTGSGTIDTIGVVSKLAKLYGVTLSQTRDSVQFDPRGLNLDNATTVTVRFAGTSGRTDSIVVNQLGKVVH
jgi:prepilin-type N-terminal cleavage/methylation domain-containing protein